MEFVESELRALEPLLHGPAWIADRERLEGRLAPSYWEVGASGRVYTREFVVASVVSRKTDPMDDSWVISEFAVTGVGGQTYMVTYLLRQADRQTRRVTLWTRGGDDWQVLYHQGTVVSG